MGPAAGRRRRGRLHLELTRPSAERVVFHNAGSQSEQEGEVTVTQVDGAKSQSHVALEGATQSSDSEEAEFEFEFRPFLNGDQGPV